VPTQPTAHPRLHDGQIDTEALQHGHAGSLDRSLYPILT
jgi:hypothetical protein